MDAAVVVSDYDDGFDGSGDDDDVRDRTTPSVPTVRPSTTLSETASARIEANKNAALARRQAAALRNAANEGKFISDGLAAAAADPGSQGPTVKRSRPNEPRRKASGWLRDSNAGFLYDEADDGDDLLVHRIAGKFADGRLLPQQIPTEGRFRYN